jgi:hypothetical protein
MRVVFPTRVDPDGRDVTIAINRDTYSAVTVTGTVSITSTVTGAGAFDGYSLEVADAGTFGNKDPIAPGTYPAFVRGNRLELQDVPGFENVQIHIANTFEDVQGCFALGSTRTEDYVGESTAAVNAMLDIVKKDGTGRINVVVNGPSTSTGEPKHPQPQAEIVGPASQVSPITPYSGAP